MKNEKIHSMLLGLVGGYLLYLAWDLYEKYRDKAGEMAPALNIVFIIIFALGGLGTLYYAWVIYRKDRKETEEKEQNEKQEEEQDNN